MVGKTIKSFLLILFLIFAFIDAANIVDLFSDTEVIHFDEGSPDSSDYVYSSAALYQHKINSSYNSSSKTNFSSHARKKSSLPKLLIYDQDSPSVVQDVQAEEVSIATFEPSDCTIP
ncbi:MAG: hypothetical protein AB1775_13475, partial [Bacteroidota bacterium]